MSAIRLLMVAVALWTALTVVPSFAEERKLSATDRSIGKLPVLNDPIYALAVFGKNQETRVWLVADKSSPQATGRDVLYIDLNADGDLTGADERIAGNLDSNSARFSLPEWTDPVTGVRHTDLSLRLTDGQRATHMLSIKWRGERKLGGGYPVDPENGYMRFGTSTENAPIVWFNGDGPFQFQPWFNDAMKIGSETDLKLFLGQIGVGENSFCAFQQHVLDQEEYVVATLVYTDKQGQQREATSNLDRRC